MQLTQCVQCGCSSVSSRHSESWLGYDVAVCDGLIMIIIDRCLSKLFILTTADDYLSDIVLKVPISLKSQCQSMQHSNGF